MDTDISTIDGSCHCGTVRFRVRLTNGLHTARRCTCSYCRMRGAIAVSADLGGVDNLSGAEALSRRISPEKAVDQAIWIAKRCGVPLKIAAKVDAVDRDYFESEIRKLLMPPDVEYTRWRRTLSASTCRRVLPASADDVIQ